MKTDAFASCTLCPRACGVDRRAERGVCGEGAELRAARAMLHLWEEPCISGTRGSGAVFFSGCPLGCAFCQNRDISRGGTGFPLSPDRLAEIFLDLQSRGAHNVNLVTAMHFAPLIEKAVAAARTAGLCIPVLFNSGGYESASTVRRLATTADAYLPDLKFFSPDLSARYAAAPDYFPRAIEAIRAMVETAGVFRTDADGMLVGGVLVRHMVLPSHRKDSIRVLEELADAVDVRTIRLSLMCQYTPGFDGGRFPELSRRVTTFEYESVIERARELGFVGYSQERDSASGEFVPRFNGDGIL